MDTKKELATKKKYGSIRSAFQVNYLQLKKLKPYEYCAAIYTFLADAFAMAVVTVIRSADYLEN